MPKTVQQYERALRRLERQLAKAQQMRSSYERLFEEERLHVCLLRQLSLQLLPRDKRDADGLRNALIRYCSPVPKGFYLAANGYLLPAEEALLPVEPLKLVLAKD